MNFLAPLFLLGGLAVALPIVFHLIRRTSKEKLTFSSLMFLQPTPPRVTRRNRLENIFLLALRCLLVALAGFLVARFIGNVGTENMQKDVQHLVVIDDTLSMTDRFPDEKKKDTTSFEVDEPILNSPFREPTEHWVIEEGKPPERRAGKRPDINNGRYACDVCVSGCISIRWGKDPIDGAREPECRVGAHRLPLEPLAPVGGRQRADLRLRAECCAGRRRDAGGDGGA